jgi:hypothetical protein
MGDVVQCKAVLSKSPDKSVNDLLYVAVPPDYRARILPCRPRAEPRRAPGGRPEWNYFERPDGKLEVSPSMLCTDTQFHTDNPWICDYEVRPEGVGMSEHFEAINPGYPGTENR